MITTTYTVLTYGTHTSPETAKHECMLFKHLKPPVQYPYTFVKIYGTFCGLRAMSNERNNWLHRIYVGCLCFKCSAVHFTSQAYQWIMFGWGKRTILNLSVININFIVIAHNNSSSLSLIFGMCCPHSLMTIKIRNQASKRAIYNV